MRLLYQMPSQIDLSTKWDWAFGESSPGIIHFSALENISIFERDIKLNSKKNDYFYGSWHKNSNCKFFFQLDSESSKHLNKNKFMEKKMIIKFIVG